MNIKKIIIFVAIIAGIFAYGNVSDYDLESWGADLNRKAATLITQKHFISAKHYHPAYGNVVQYIDNETGNVFTGIVDAYQYTIAGTDIYIGRFINEISTQISPVDISDVSYLPSGTPLLSGHKGFVTYESEVLSYFNDFNVGLLIRYYNPLIASGDSSHPSYTLVNGQTQLIGVHYGALGDYAYDSPLGLHYNEIATVVGNDGYPIGISFPETQLYLYNDVITGLTLHWFAMDGFGYYVEQSSDLQTWNTISSEIIGNNQNIKYPVQIIGNTSFWRLKIVHDLSGSFILVNPTYSTPPQEENPPQEEEPTKGWGKGGKPKNNNPKK